MVLNFRHSMPFVCCCLLFQEVHSLDDRLSERDRLQNIIYNTFDALFEKENDWQVAHDLAASYMFHNPTPALMQTVESQLNAIVTYFGRVFIGKKNQDHQGDESGLQQKIKPLLSSYFDYQCQNLYANFLAWPKNTHHYWCSDPTEYTVTLVYEEAAIGRGIFLKNNYHRFYGLAYENQARIQFIEAENDKNSPMKMVLPTPKPPAMSPLMPPPVLKLHTGIRMSKSDTRDTQKMNLESLVQDLRKPISGDMLAEIRGGVMLKRVDASSLRPPKVTDPHIIALQRAFKKIRPDIQGDNCF